MAFLLKIASDYRISHWGIDSREIQAKKWAIPCQEIWPLSTCLKRVEAAQRAVITASLLIPARSMAAMARATSP